MGSVVISLHEDTSLQHSLTFLQLFYLTIGSKLAKMIASVVLGTGLSLLSSGTTSEDDVTKVPRNAVMGMNKHYKQFLRKKEEQLSF